MSTHLRLSLRRSSGATLLIVGLGNPGKEYARTRHNAGFLVVQELAKNLGWEFKKAPSLQGEVALGKIEETKIILLLPTTYMNLSGVSIRKCLDYYKIPVEEMLVVVDEVYLKFGTLRYRLAGSAGGHNGLKSAEEHLNTQNYARLRMGVGPEKNEDFPDRERLDLKDFVLGPFTEAEREKLPAFIERGAKALESWIKEGKIQ